MSAALSAMLHQHVVHHVPRHRPQSFTSLLLRCTSRSKASRPFLTPFQRRLQTTYAPEVSSSRSVTLRILRSLLTATAFLSLGIYIGWETLPSRQAIAAILTTPPTDAETLQIFQPPDELSKQINDTIVGHPMAQQLRKNPDLVESRPHLKIPEPIRATNLTGGTLAGPGKIVVPPLSFADKEGRQLVSIFYLGEQLCGHPGIIHGGLLATLLDEGLARCCFGALPNKIGVTAHLVIDYRVPVKAGEYYVLRATTTRVEGRKAWVTGWIERLKDGQTVVDEGSGQKLVEAEALFLEPRNAQVMRRIYHAE